MFVEIMGIDGNILGTLSEGKHELGRGAFLQCQDRRVSRKQAYLDIYDDKVIVRAANINPVYYAPAAEGNKTMIILMMGQHKQLNSGDKIGFLPHEYWYKINIKTGEHATTSTSSSEVMPKNENKYNYSDDSSEEIPARKPSKESLRKKRSLRNFLLKDDDESEPDNKKIKKDDDESDENRDNVDTDENESDFTYKRYNPESEDEKETDNSAEGNGENNTENESTDNTNTASENGDGKDVVRPKKNTEKKDKKQNNEIAKGANTEIEDKKQDKSIAKGALLPCSSHIDNERPSTSGNNAPVKNKPRRERCRYGAGCYRKNKVHHETYAHPNDSDYATDPEDDRKDCPYGAKCYRKNPKHRQAFKHVGPPASKPRKKDDNVKKTRNGAKQGYEEFYGDNSSDSDPYAGSDSDDDFVASLEDSDDDDDDDEDYSDEEEDEDKIKTKAETKKKK